MQTSCLSFVYWITQHFLVPFKVGITRWNLSDAMMNQLDMVVFTHMEVVTHSAFVMLSSAFLTLLCNSHIFTDYLVLTTANIMVEKGLVNQQVTNLQCKMSSIGSVKNTRNTVRYKFIKSGRACFSCLGQPCKITENFLICMTLKIFVR